MSAMLVIAISIVSIKLRNIYQDELVHTSSQQIFSSLQQTADSINHRLVEVNNALDQVTTDAHLTSFFIQEQSESQTLQANKLYLNTRFLNNAISRYLNKEDIDTYLLYTNSYILGGLFSTLSPSLSPSIFRKSTIYQIAVDAAYRTVWIPAFNPIEQLSLAEYSTTSQLRRTRKVFSAVRQLNFMSIENDQLYLLPARAERPIIMVNFQSEVLYKWIGNNLGYNQGRYRLLSEDKSVFHIQGMPIDHDTALPAHYQTNDEGIGRYTEGGEMRLAFISPIQSSGWFLTYDMPLSEVLGNTGRETFNLLSTGLLLLLIFSFIITFLIAKGLTQPIQALTASLREVGDGNFSVRVKMPRDKELRELSDAFNQMGAEVQRLIRENYEISLKETQAQLSALNLQINPHFLYNTLSVINIIALENEQVEISSLVNALSGLLKYSLRPDYSLVMLKEEMTWLADYLVIMEARYPGMFEVEYDVDETTLQFKVPKMILQPIFENSFLHGQIGSKPGGHILLSSKFVDGMLHLAIIDNGVGMDAESSMVHMRLTQPTNGIGLTNAYQRLKLIYGDKANIVLSSDENSGTCVQLLIPCSPL